MSRKYRIIDYDKVLKELLKSIKKGKENNEKTKFKRRRTRVPKEKIRF